MTPCPCGEKHKKGSNFYVSVKDEEGKYGLLAGPFRTHAEALALVDIAARMVKEMDDEAENFTFGTVEMKPEYTQPGMLNEQLNLPA